MADEPVDITKILELKKINEELGKGGFRTITMEELQEAQKPAIAFDNPTSKGELVPFQEPKPEKGAGLLSVLKKAGRRLPGLGLLDILASNRPSQKVFEERLKKVQEPPTLRKDPAGDIKSGLETVIDFVKGKNPPISRRDFGRGIWTATQLAGTPNLPISPIPEVQEIITEVKSTPSSLTVPQVNTAIRKLRKISDRLHNEGSLGVVVQDAYSNYDTDQSDKESQKRLKEADTIDGLINILRESHKEYDTSEDAEEHWELDKKLGMSGSDYGDEAWTLEEKRDLLKNMPSDEEFDKMHKRFIETRKDGDILGIASKSYKRKLSPTEIEFFEDVTAEGDNYDLLADAPSAKISIDSKGKKFLEVAEQDMDSFMNWIDNKYTKNMGYKDIPSHIRTGPKWHLTFKDEEGKNYWENIKKATGGVIRNPYPYTPRDI